MRKWVWLVVVPSVAGFFFVTAMLIGGLSQIFGRVDRWELQGELALTLIWISLIPAIALFLLGSLPVWKKRPKIGLVHLEAASIILAFFFGAFGAAVQARQSPSWYAACAALSIGWLGWYENESARPWRRRIRLAAVAVLAWLIIRAASM